MKGYVCLFVLLVSSALMAQSNNVNSEEEAVLKTERAWLAASQKNDIATLKSIIADDFVGSGPGGNLLSKEMITGVPEGAPPFDKSTLTEMSAKVFGNTAVVFGKLASTNPADPTTTRFAMFYAKRGGEWQMVAAQLVPVPASNDTNGE